MPLPPRLASPLFGPVLLKISEALAVWIDIGARPWELLFSNPSALSQEHLDSLAAQNMITEERINNFRAEIEELTQEASHLKQEVKDASTATTVSVAHLHELSDRIMEINEKLTVIVHAAKDANASISESFPALKEISDASHIKGITAITMLGELSGLLNVKANAIIQISQNTDVLQHTVEEQLGTISRLTEAVQTLTDENDTQRQIIVKKNAEITQLKDLSARLTKHVGFFTNKLPQAGGPMDMPQSSDSLTQMQRGLK